MDDGIVGARWQCVEREVSAHTCFTEPFTPPFAPKTYTELVSRPALVAVESCHSETVR